jgi:FkbM family methyltransferase
VTPGTRRITLKRVVRTVTPRTMRNWLRSPSRSAEWIWDGLQFACGVSRDLEIAPGWHLKCHPRAYRVFLRDQVTDQNQREEFRSFLKHCQSGMRLFDIGAHFGVFSLATARAGGTAIAVDPSADALRIVESEAAINGYGAAIESLRAAVTSSSGSMGLLSSGVFSAGYFKVAPNEPGSELTQIPTVTIDYMTERFGVPTHIKIDVEGHEAAALQGSKVTFSRSSPLLFLEFHNEMVTNDGGDPNAAVAELYGLGYAAFDFNGEPLEAKALLAPPIARFVARREKRS